MRSRRDGRADCDVGEVAAYPEDEVEEHQQSLHAGHRGHGLQSLAHLGILFVLFLPSCSQTKTLRSMGYYALAGRTWSQRADRFARGFASTPTCACVAPAPLSTGACALPREDAMAIVGLPLSEQFSA